MPVLGAIALLAGCAHIPAVLETAAAASIACDGGTTRQFLADGDSSEANPLLGQHPPIPTVLAYNVVVIGMLIVVDGALESLPHGPALAGALSTAVLATEAATIAHNMQVGNTLCGIGHYDYAAAR